MIFANKLQPLLELVRKTTPTTDNKDLKKRLAEAVGTLLQEVSLKINIMQHTSVAGFYVNDYLRHKAIYLIGDEEKETKKNRKTKTKEPKAPRIPTYEISYQLYKEGKTPTEIAMIRQLAVSTINSHLVRYVQSGEIELSELMPMEHIILGKKALEKYHSMKEAFESLNGQVGYGELNLIKAAESSVD